MRIWQWMKRERNNMLICIFQVDTHIITRISQNNAQYFHLKQIGIYCSCSTINPNKTFFYYDVTEIDNCLNWYNPFIPVTVLQIQLMRKHFVSQTDAQIFILPKKLINFAQQFHPKTKKKRKIRWNVKLFCFVLNRIFIFPPNSIVVQTRGQRRDACQSHELLVNGHKHAL